MQYKYPHRFFGIGFGMEAKINALLQTIHQSVGIGLHLGCGPVIIPGLINCDLYHPAAEKKLDCMDLSQYADGSVDLIESHHMIEHLTFEEFDRCLKEWYRALKPGGLIVLTTPNLTWISIRWLWLTLASWFTNSDTAREYALKMFYGPQIYEGMVHKSGYDPLYIKKKLAGFGFTLEFSHTPYPNRPTPSLLVMARKLS